MAKLFCIFIRSAVIDRAEDSLKRDIRHTRLC